MLAPRTNREGSPSTPEARLLVALLAPATADAVGAALTGAVSGRG